MKKILIFISVLQSLVSSAQFSFSLLPNQPPDNMVSIVTDPVNNDLYAAGTLRIIKSINNGGSWTITANTGAQNLNILFFTAAGQLYAGADKTNTSAVGLIRYDKVNNVWSEVPGSPQDITAIVEDNSGNLLLGTGTTGNYTASNSINKGSGFFYYNIAANTFTSINNGVANVPGYAVLPFIKSLKKNSAGIIYAATYGNGVIRWSGTSWSNYGTGLGNNYVNVLQTNANDSLYAGTDAGMSVIGNAGGAWSGISAGLPTAKPVRSLTIDASGKIYAGLGFYHYQNGNMAGDIYASVNSGTSWQNTASGYIGGVVYALLSHSSGNVFCGSAGIWKSAYAAASWAPSMAGVRLANQTIKMVQNSAGDIFVLCRNNLLGTRLPYGGVFRSADHGVTWTQLVNGIKAQCLFEIFVDSHDNIWLSGSTLKSNANQPGTIWGTPELYKSTNNGSTWVKNTSIVLASDTYNHIAETRNGKIYVASSFGTSVSNLSSSADYNNFDNTLKPPPTNGNYSFGLAVNNANDVFHGTETGGLMRSVSNGAPGSFATITAIAANTIVYIDPYTQNVYCNVGNVMTTGVNMYASNTNGNSFVPLLNFPAIWAVAQDMAFTNTGKIFTVVNSSHFDQVGLYLSQSPVTTNSNYTMQISSGTFSFYFNSLFIDRCGFLYGVAQGGGISVSNIPVNTPLQCTLNIPVNNAIGISLTPTMNWSPVCTPDSFRLQIATDSFFINIVKDQVLITSAAYNMPGGILNAGIKYYWRVYGVNAAGAGVWSAVNNFTAASVVPLSFIDFTGNFNDASGSTLLHWATANEMNNDHFTIEKSVDAITFLPIATVLPSPLLAYSFTDTKPFSTLSFYRIRQVDINGKTSFSKIIAVYTGGRTLNAALVFPNPTSNECCLLLPPSLSGYVISVHNLNGSVIIRMESKKSEKQISFSISSMSAGLYIIKLTDKKTGNIIRASVSKN